MGWRRGEVAPRSRKWHQRLSTPVRGRKLRGGGRLTHPYRRLHHGTSRRLWAGSCRAAPLSASTTKSWEVGSCVDQEMYFKVQGTFTPKKVPYSLTVPVTYFFGPETPGGGVLDVPRCWASLRGCPPGALRVGRQSGLGNRWRSLCCGRPGTHVLASHPVRSSWVGCRGTLGLIERRLFELDEEIARPRGRAEIAPAGVSDTPPKQRDLVGPSRAPGRVHWESRYAFKEDCGTTSADQASPAGMNRALQPHLSLLPAVHGQQAAVGKWAGRAST